MENISSETCLFDDNITAVDIILHSSFFDTSATTHQFLKHHTTHQVDKFQQQTITSSTKSSSFSMASHEQVEEEENEKLRPTTSLVNNKDILSRVYAAQCKLYGFFETQKNVNAEEEGFRELYELKEYPEAYYPLGCWYYDQSDYRQAYAWFEKCSNNNSSAKYRMALLLLLHEHSNPNLEKAFHLMTESANEGNYYAQFMLGVYHQRGILVKKMNFQLAKMWYERSAIQGFAEAQTALCNLLIQMNMSSFKHNGVDYNKEEKQLYIEEEINKSAIKEALDWLYRAENQENASAFIRLGSLHEEGILVQQDDPKAIEYYKQATQVTSASSTTLSLAHYLVGINYRLGELGLEQNDSIAFQHLIISADLGYIPAQRTLGLMYAEKKDLAKAKELFERAASQGDARSLGLIAHTTAKSGRAGLNSVMELYEKAAKAGSLSAQLSLAVLLQNTGQFTLAYNWFEIASKTSTSTNGYRYGYRRRLRRSTQSITGKNQQQEKLLNLDINNSAGFLAQRNTARLIVARYKLSGFGGAVVKQEDRLWAFQEFYTLCHDEEFSDAYYWLAACYEEGITEVVVPSLDLAFKWYSKSAIAGDIDSQFQVAYMLSNGYYSEKESRLVKDRESAFSWYIKAAEQGHSTAQYSVGLYFEHGLFVDVDIEIAKNWYELAAKGDVTLSMVRLARLLVVSNTIMDNVPKAFDWLKIAILKGDVSALRELATFYKNGLIAANDDNISQQQQQQKRAFDLFQQAADLDDAMSWHALSKYYEGVMADGEFVVPVNFEMTVFCLQKAEKLGYSVAGLDLADLYYRNRMMDDTLKVYLRLGDDHETCTNIGWKSRLGMAKIVIFEKGVLGSYRTKVHSWLMDMSTRSKNDRELAEVCELLGYCADYGIGTSTNKEESVHYYTASSSTSNDNHGDWSTKQRSICRLADLHMEEKNYEYAFISLEKLKPNLEEAAIISEKEEIGHRRMIFYLGYLLLHGLGTTADIAHGLYWLSKAADKGQGDAAYELGQFIQDDDEQVKSRYEQGIMAGHAGCMRALALLLLSEENDQCFAPEDEEVYDGGAEILKLLEMAADLKDTEAIYQLGLAYENGLGTVISNKDIEKALGYYIHAAERNHELAMIKAGEILGNILGLQAEAIQWFQKAVNLANNIKAKVMLVSYDFQGYTSSLSTKQNHDARNFEILRDIIEEGFALMEKESTKLSSNSKREQQINKDGLGLAFYILGQCYELGRGTYVNLGLAKEWYHRSIVISQHVDAMYRLGLIYSTFEENNVSALEWYRNATERGRHRESHYQLGLFHLHGLGGLEVNIIAAQKYFSKASDQGHPLATYELARIIWNHHCDYIYGYELFKLAAQLHVADASRELGRLSHTGFLFHGIVIVQQDYKRAFAYYCEAAQMGDPISALMVGNYFEEGYLQEELGQDYERALQWYESAYRLNGGGLAELAIGKLKHTMSDAIADPKEAEDIREEAFVWFESAASDPINTIQGVYAKVMVALYHLNGWGRKPQDAKTGFNMLLDIAEHGGREAFVSVARCYEQGVGIENNMKKAIDYWEMAADMDDQGALIRVGEIYEFGLSCPVDKEAAYSYYNRAEMIGISKIWIVGCG